MKDLLSKPVKRNVVIAIVGLIAMVAGWSEAFEEQLINTVLMALGGLGMLQDTVINAAKDTLESE